MPLLWPITAISMLVMRTSDSGRGLHDLAGRTIVVADPNLDPEEQRQMAMSLRLGKASDGRSPSGESERLTVAIPLRDDAPTRRTPWVTWALILANIVMFLFLQPAFFQSGRAELGVAVHADIQELRKAEAFLYKWGAIPCEIEQDKPLAGSPIAAAATSTSRRAPHLLPAAQGGLAGPAHVDVPARQPRATWPATCCSSGSSATTSRTGWVTSPYLIFYLVGGVIAALGHVVFNQAIDRAGRRRVRRHRRGDGRLLRVQARGRILTVVVTAAFQVVYIPAFVVLGLFFVTQFFTPTSSNVAWEAHAVGMAAGRVRRVRARPLLPGSRSRRGRRCRQSRLP